MHIMSNISILFIIYLSHKWYKSPEQTLILKLIFGSNHFVSSWLLVDYLKPNNNNA